MTKQILWNKAELADALKQKIDQDLGNITGASIDTRTIETGDIFLALKGNNFDGNAFSDEAIEKGASLCIVDEIDKIKENNRNKIILVENVADALNSLAKYRRNSLKGKVICITGSLGKTTTKEMLRSTLSACGKTHASSRNLNNHYGLPLSLIRTPVDTEFCILELGMSSVGEIRSLSKIAQPNIAIITNVEAVHLEFFNSITEIAYAKAEVFENMKLPSFGIINISHIHSDILRQQADKNGVQIIAVGNNIQADCYIVKTERLANGDQLVDINCLGKNIQQKFSKDIGKHLINNSLAVFACVSLLNANLTVTQKALEKFMPFTGRGEITKLSHNITLIDESYNASPVAVAASIKNLTSRKKENSRAIAILGDMKELGKKEIRFHQSINLEGVDKIFCVGSLMKQLYDKACHSVKGAFTKNAEEMADIIANYIQNSDTILIKGSFSMNMKLIVEKIKKEFK